MVLHGMKMLRVLLVALAFTSISAPSWAQDLDALRSSGAVGERFDGLAVARDASAASFVASVNAQRSKIYQERAAKEGVPAEQVGMVYGKEIRGKAPAGTWFLLQDGSWAQK
ncbi:YdbL family protein [Kiloniella laminariae]|uniref:YdbL family protein n=1 Tax=Kiloniella laminariae TaxID=454162 RepID=UPI0003650A0E|nr:YdbL family protein [Kiloniella laminariae]